MLPALEDYAEFLETQYLPEARETISVTELPNGEECYPVAIRYYATVARDPDEVHQLGLDQIAVITAEREEISARSFDNMPVPAPRDSATKALMNLTKKPVFRGGAGGGANGRTTSCG